MAKEIGQQLGVFSALACEDVAYVGGGSLPDQTLKTWVVEVQCQTLSDSEFARRLRAGLPAVLARLREGKLVLDLRTIFPHEDAEVVLAMQKALTL